MCEFWSIVAWGCRFGGLSTAGCAHLGQCAEPTLCCTPIPEPGCCRAVSNTWGAATAKGRQRGTDGITEPGVSIPRSVSMAIGCYLPCCSSEARAVLQQPQAQKSLKHQGKSVGRKTQQQSGRISMQSIGTVTLCAPAGDAECTARSQHSACSSLQLHFNFTLKKTGIQRGKVSLLF